MELSGTTCSIQPLAWMVMVVCSSCFLTLPQTTFHRSRSRAGRNSPGGRWGDYFGAAVNPSDRTHVWVAGEFQASSLDVVTDSHIAELKFATKVGPTVVGPPVDKD